MKRVRTRLRVFMSLSAGWLAATTFPVFLITPPKDTQKRLAELLQKLARTMASKGKLQRRVTSMSFTSATSSLLWTRVLPAKPYARRPRTALFQSAPGDCGVSALLRCLLSITAALLWCLPPCVTLTHGSLPGASVPLP